MSALSEIPEKITGNRPLTDGIPMGTPCGAAAVIVQSSLHKKKSFSPSLTPALLLLLALPPSFCNE